ncbi:MAG: transketolase [Chloroflexota bacterium]|nr:MAG: transketolase [Chloroflexota bacterium]
MEKIDQLAINTIRTLAMDAVQSAGTGHPGTAMGAADVIYTLWTKHLKHNPNNPEWLNRDRFVLSAGHASMLLYSMLYLTGYENLTLDEIKKYRRYGSLTPGHPENYLTQGVEVTTGPLGQGFSNAVGMAIAEAHLSEYYNRPGFDVIDNYIYAFAGDGDLMEGVSQEAASLAGHLKLEKLIVIYDDNRVTIEGDTGLAFTEDRAKRFEAYHWHVQKVDGYDTEAISAAIEAAKADPRPSIIMSRSHIAYGSPNKQDSSSAHGAPLGEDEVRLTKEKLDWPLEPAFFVPDEVLTHTRTAVQKGENAEKEWQTLFDGYKKEYPELASEMLYAFAGKLPAGWDKDMPEFSPEDGPMPARVASGKVLNNLAGKIPMILGGAADVGPSIKTILDNAGDFTADDRAGRNLHFGVREHAMGGILNGLSLYGGLIPYGGTYFIFSDYMRPSMRMAALMGLPVIYVFSHDSVLIGTDGPTHQPVEHIASYRAVPNMTVLRPCDANEVTAAWRVALENQTGPTMLLLARHAIPILAETQEDCFDNLSHGAYVLSPADNQKPELLLMGTGSEVHLLLEAQKILLEEGIHASVISFPSMEIFEKQAQEYKNQVLPQNVLPRLAVEAGSSMGWWKYVGSAGDVFSVDRFGIPGSTEDVIEFFKFTGEGVAERARSLLAK